MKAFMGDEIACDCLPPAGRFRRDVEDGANILTDDIAIPLPWSTIEAWRYVCPTCHVTVAQNFGDHWRVLTRNGRLE